MRPLKGLVVATAKAGFMKIEMESGNVVITKRVSGISRGDKVEVFYDFDHNRVRDVRLDQPDVPTPDEPDFGDREEIIELSQKTISVIDEPEEFSSPDFDELEWEEWASEKELEDSEFSFPKIEDEGVRSGSEEFSSPDFEGGM
jgi:hypothetical protein